MGTPAEARELVAHFLNVSYPYNYSSPKFALIGDGVEELNEEFEADEEDIQYIHEKTKTRNVKGYTVGFDIELKYIKNNELQIYANRMIRKPPTGLDTKSDYIRINKDEPMYGTSNAYIGVRRQATVYPQSIGGSADDSLGSSLHISGNTEPEVGYVTFGTDGYGNPTYTWTSANGEVPIITSPVNGASLTGSTVTVVGTGTVGATIRVYYGIGDSNSTTATVGSSGDWSVEIPASNFGSNNVTIAAKQTIGDINSVTCNPVSFTIIRSLEIPTITSPTNNATDVSLTPTIAGTGVNGATITVNDVTDETPTSLGTATVGSEGNWSLTLSTALTASTEYTIKAVETYNGLTAESSQITFTTGTGE